MKYDPIKKGLGKVFNKNPILRKIFYRFLDILLLRTWHIKKEVRMIKKELDNKAEILDAGAGFGQYVFYMSSFSPHWSITGIDLKEEQIQDCNQFFARIGLAERVKFEKADLTKMTAHEKYNFILCVDVMEHIEEDEIVLKNFATSLKKNGMLLISTPSDQGGSDVHSKYDDSFIDEHVREGYSTEEIKNKILNAGFSSVTVRYSYGWPGTISWRLSMKYPISALNFSKLFYIFLPVYYVVTYPFIVILNILDVNLKHKRGTGLIVKAKK